MPSSKGMSPSGLPIVGRSRSTGRSLTRRCVTQNCVTYARVSAIMQLSVTARNPFQYGDLALDEAFTDRRAELDALRADMVNGQNVAIIAPRRFGKSSLVKRAAQELVT